MLPAQQQAFAASLVVYKLGAINPAFYEYQALDNLIQISHTSSKDDYVFNGVNDPAITSPVAKVLSGAIKGGKIWRIQCNKCVQVRFGTEGTLQPRLPQRPQHTPSQYLPDDVLPSWIGNRAQITYVANSLQSHTSGRHEGVFDYCYESFWELPLIVKRAILMATYYQNMPLGKNNGLGGLAVTVMNWKFPE